MQLTRRPLAVLVMVALLAAACFWAWQRTSAASRDTPKVRDAAVPVDIAVAERQSLPVFVNANGYVTPINTVDVRPQTQNIVRAVHVKEGQQVQAGQLLFTLDDREDRSNVDKARAQLARDRADLNDAQQVLDRNRDLLAKGFVSQAVVDTAKNRVDGLRNTLRADEAGIEASTVAAGYNRITASIAGRIGAINVHPGSLAQPAGTPMLTIAQIDPIAVAFSLPERDLGFLRASYPDGGATVTARLPDGAERSGKLYFIDNAADPQTGTIRMKAEFANRDHRMWPGMYVPVRLVTRTIADAVTLPAQAVVTGPVDKIVYVVGADDKVAARKVTIGAIVDGRAAVTGIDSGTRVVVEGNENLRDGVKVRPTKGAAPDSAEPPGR